MYPVLYTYSKTAIHTDVNKVKKFMRLKYDFSVFINIEIHYFQFVFHDSNDGKEL